MNIRIGFQTPSLDVLTNEVEKYARKEGFKVSKSFTNFTVDRTAKELGVLGKRMASRGVFYCFRRRKKCCFSIRFTWNGNTKRYEIKAMNLDHTAHEFNCGGSDDIITNTLQLNLPDSEVSVEPVESVSLPVVDTRKLISLAPYERNYAMSRAVVQGNWCFVSGTVGQDSNGDFPENPIEQTNNIFKRIKKALHKANFNMIHIVRVQYTVSNHLYIDKILPVIRREMGGVLPASTMVVASLVDPRMKVEIEVTCLKSDLQNLSENISTSLPKYNSITTTPPVVSVSNNNETVIRNQLSNQIIEMANNVSGNGENQNNLDRILP